MNAMLATSVFYPSLLENFKQWCDIIRHIVGNTAMWRWESFLHECMIKILSPELNSFSSRPTHTFPASH